MVDVPSPSVQRLRDVVSPASISRSRGYHSSRSSYTSSTNVKKRRSVSGMMTPPELWQCKETHAPLFYPRQKGVDHRGFSHCGRWRGFHSSEKSTSRSGSSSACGGAASCSAATARERKTRALRASSVRWAQPPDCFPREVRPVLPQRRPCLRPLPFPTGSRPEPIHRLLRLALSRFLLRRFPSSRGTPSISVTTTPTQQATIRPNVLQTTIATQPGTFGTLTFVRIDTANTTNANPISTLNATCNLVSTAIRLDDREMGTKFQYIWHFRRFKRAVQLLGEREGYLSVLSIPVPPAFSPPCALLAPFRRGLWCARPLSRRRDVSLGL